MLTRKDRRRGKGATHPWAAPDGATASAAPARVVSWLRLRDRSVLLLLLFWGEKSPRNFDLEDVVHVNGTTRRNGAERRGIGWLGLDRRIELRMPQRGQGESLGGSIISAWRF